jgi:hypothetical protein
VIGFVESEMQQVVAHENWATAVTDNKIQVNARISIRSITQKIPDGNPMDFGAAQAG